MAGRWSLVAGGLVLVAVVLMAALAGLLFPDDPQAMVAQPLLWPGSDAAFPLGTDSLGRDIMAGLFYGARASLLIGFVSTAAALVVGGTVGAIAGYYRGPADDALMRISELVQTIPQFMLVIVLVVIFRPSIGTIIAALALVSWPGLARLVRAEFIVLREREFVEACRTMGLSDWRIIVIQILPNAFPTIIVSATILVASAILMEAALSFLGLGDPNLLTWGSMIGAGKDQLRSAWYIVVLPGAALLITALGLNLFGEGLNDALNPRNRRR